MESFLTTLLTIAALHLLAVISPGPDFALVIKNSLLYSRKLALRTALGIGLGIWVHVFYTIFGLAVLISRSEQTWLFFKYLGSGFVIYLGIKALMSTAAPRSSQQSLQRDDRNKRSEITPLAALKEGFLCNALNPKATLFFLSVFTLVVKPQTPIWMQVVYGMEMSIVTFLWFSFLVTIATHPPVRLRLESVQIYLVWLMGVVLICLGLKLFIAEFPVSSDIL